MPVNKAAVARYHVINRYLRTHDHATLYDLKYQCEELLGYKISERQIYRDIHDMRYDKRLGYFAPISTHRSKDLAWYSYSDRSFTIEKIPLSEDELNALIFAAGILEQMKDLPVLEHLQDAIHKIAHHLRIRKHLTDEEFNEFIDIEKSVGLKGSEYLDPLINTIRNRTVVKLKYHAFGRERAYTHIFHPYLLKEYRNRWYVFGYNRYWDGLRVYGLDRIEEIESLPEEDYISCQASPRDYFRNIIGVTRFEDTSPQKIVLKFSKQQAPYILTQPLHESQKIVKATKDYVVVSLMVHPSPELQILLLGWSREVEVLEPEDFRNEIKGMIEEALGNYG